MQVVLLGATGTIGQGALRALVAAGHRVTAPVRDGPRAAGAGQGLPGVTVTTGGLAEAMTGAEAVVSCMASRTGAPADSWAVDHDAQVTALEAAQAAGVSHFVLLSAICVQKPELAFQQAKLAFEARLMASGLIWSIVRSTAYFKSLSGQVDRLRAGKPFLLFGDGTQTACKPISDDDLGRYLALCLTESTLQNRILPIGGPGPALTPREMGEELFRLLDKPPKFKKLPLGMMDAIVGGLSLGGRLSSGLRQKAELAKIGRYYARESMLVWDAAAGRYDAAATPEFGSETLFDFYARLVSGEARVDRGDHAVF